MSRIPSSSPIRPNEPTPPKKPPFGGRPLPPIPPRPEGPTKMPPREGPPKVYSSKNPPPRPARKTDDMGVKILGAADIEKSAQSTYVGEFFATEFSFNKNLGTYISAIESAKLSPKEKEQLGLEELKKIKSLSDWILKQEPTRAGMKRALNNPDIIRTFLPYTHNYYPVRVPAMQALEKRLKLPEGAAHFGIQPMQRITKYPLLVEQGIKRQSFQGQDVAKALGEQMTLFNSQISQITDGKEYQRAIGQIRKEVEKLTREGSGGSSKKLEGRVMRVDRALQQCKRVGFAASEDQKKLLEMRKSLISSIQSKGLYRPIELHKQFSKLVPESVQKTGNVEAHAAKIKNPKRAVAVAKALYEALKISDEAHSSFQTKQDLIVLRGFIEALEKRIPSAT